MKLRFLFSIWAAIVLLIMPIAPVSHATGIEQLLLKQVPIPKLRPTLVPQNGIQQITVSSTTPVSNPAKFKKIAGIRGSLRDGLDALSKKDTAKARGILAGMGANSLEAKTLGWAIALSGQIGIPSGQIAKISREVSDWPGHIAMRRNAEAAMARENLSSSAIIKAFGKQKPESLTGAILLAQAHLQRGNKKAAHAIIAPFWHRTKMSKKTEARVLKKVGAALGIKDHRTRMHYMFYRDRVKAANRMALRAQQVSLAKARAAVSKRSKDAGKLLKNVAASSRKDAGYTFSKIQYLRRAKKYQEAGKLLASAPRDATTLVHPDEWWIERRIVSRALIDQKNYRLAYKLAAEHSAKSRTKRAEAEFHAGWYALRFLKNRTLARKHFRNILKISNTPISQARGLYWLGRSHSGGKARKYFTDASRHQGTYYGQLSLIKLGKRGLSVRSQRSSAADRARFNSRELVKVINLLEANKYGWRADILYRHLAKSLQNSGEIALLSARAEKLGNRKLALQIGKIAYRRGLPAITSSWPIGAIPNSAKIGSTNRALAYSIARQESAFDPAAVSGANARGLLQLLPGTAKLMAKKTGVKYSYKKLTRDPAYNATLGTAYLKEQLSNFSGSYILTFSGYNAGPGRAKKWIAKYGDPRGKPLDYVVDWVERIPFTETRNYVQRVMENMQIYKARIGKSRLEIDKDLVQGRR